MRALLVAVLLLVGCGGLSRDFSGTWKGTGATISKGLRASAPMKLHLTASGARLTVSGLCEGIEALGTGRAVEWKGAVSCRRPAPDCSTLTLTYRTGSVRLRPDGSLETTWAGDMEGCGTTQRFTSTFQGTR
jgi:hypothetical protein